MSCISITFCARNAIQQRVYLLVVNNTYFAPSAPLHVSFSQPFSPSFQLHMSRPCFLSAVNRIRYRCMHHFLGGGSIRNVCRFMSTTLVQQQTTAANLYKNIIFDQTKIYNSNFDQTHEKSEKRLRSCLCIREQNYRCSFLL